MYYLGTVTRLEEGKKKKEQYLFDANTFTEAEALAFKFLEEHHIIGVVSLTHKDDIFIGDIETTDDLIYHVVVEETHETDKIDKATGEPVHKVTRTGAYVVARSMTGAMEAIDYGRVVKVEETKIMGLIEP